MKTTHTPGPWNAIIKKPTKRDAPGTTLVAAGGMLAIDCYQSGESFDEDAANALLIAAAPDMLKALRNAVLALAHVCESDSADAKLYGDTYRAVSDAIAKATGAKA